MSRIEMSTEEIKKREVLQLVKLGEKSRLEASKELKLSL